MAGSVDRAPILLFLIGPPAVGKTTVGVELARRTGLVLFHNHQLIELALRFSPQDTPQFQRLIDEFRRRIVEEVATSGLPGLIFTYIWAFDDTSGAARVETYASLSPTRDARVLFVELEAALTERLRRNETKLGSAGKPSKQDLAQSRRRLLDTDSHYRLNSAGRFDGRADYLRIDTTALSPETVVEQIIAAYGLAHT